MSAIKFLNDLGMRIGWWGAIVSASPDEDACYALNPSMDALRLYVLSWEIAKWLDAREFFVMQSDHSTCAQEDEIAMARLISRGAIGAKFFDDCVPICVMKPHDAGIQEVLAGIIYFSFIFSWHVYFVPDSSVDGKRISVLDEMLCVVGKEYIVREAENLIAGIKIIQHDS